MNGKHQITRVQFSTVEDCRRRVFEVLVESGLSKTKASKIAGLVTASLRDAGQLGSSIEQHYSAADAAALIGGRCSAWAVKHAKQGDFGPVACDGGDWLIPASGLQAYLERFSVNNVNGNVKVTRKKTAVMVEFAEEKPHKARAGAGVAAGPVHGPTDKSRLELEAHASSAEVVRSSRIANDVACRPVACLE